MICWLIAPPGWLVAPPGGFGLVGCTAGWVWLVGCTAGWVWLVGWLLSDWPDSQQASIAVAELAMIACCKAQVLCRLDIHDLDGIAVMPTGCQLFGQLAVCLLGICQACIHTHCLDDWLVIPLARCVPHHVGLLVGRHGWCWLVAPLG